MTRPDSSSDSELQNLDLGEAIFGSFDGLTSAVGVVLGAMIAGAATKTLFIAGIGLAVAAAVSMGGGEWLGDTEGSRRKAVIMGLATLVGSMVPIAPYLFASGRLALFCSAAATVALSLGVARARHQLARCSVWRAYGATYGVLFAACVLSAGVAALFGLG